MERLRVSVQASPVDGASWAALARRVEAAGFDALYVADHPGTSAAPFVALAAAAAVTERIPLGTCVLNAGLWEPVVLANEVATLDLLSSGRAVLGIGAGHTPQEWSAAGRSYPTAGARVDRMIELVEATRALLAGGLVSRQGRHLTLVDAELAEPRPLQDQVPLLVGGNGTRLLRFAAQAADVVGITGAGRTLPDGHRHEVDWSSAALARTADLIRTTPSAVGRSPQVEALVQHVEITDDSAAAADRLAPHVTGASAEDLLDTPFVWIGTVAQIRERLVAHRERYGITRYVIRAANLDATLDVLAGDG